MSCCWPRAGTALRCWSRPSSSRSSRARTPAIRTKSDLSRWRRLASGSASERMDAPALIPVNQPLLAGNEKKYLAECIDSGWISSDGPFVARFEEAMAALDVAVEALGIGPGDEVVLPSFTIISCIAQIVRSGATPVLVDSDPRTWNMDVRQVDAKSTPRTKARVIVHVYGLPVDMQPFLDLARR